MLIPKNTTASHAHRKNHADARHSARTDDDDCSGGGFHGCAESELRGLHWENYDGEQVVISQSFWRWYALEPKTRESEATVPIIRQLAQRLDLHKSLSGNSVQCLMFPSPMGKPINLDALAADVIVPLITKAGIEWHGWHAFRRGLATNLPTWRTRQDNSENLAAC